jgi:hypothetical protein
MFFITRCWSFRVASATAPMIPPLRSLNVFSGSQIAAGIHPGLLKKKSPRSAGLFARMALLPGFEPAGH